MRSFVIAVFIAAFFMSPAEARHHRHHHRHIHYDYSRSDSRIVSHPAGCPGRAFCGCGVSVRVFGHPIRSLYLAANWLRFPRTQPGAGMVAVRSHHVMYIMDYSGNGIATVYDPNSGGHQTRIHTRNISRYRIVNPHGSHLASR